MNGEKAIRVQELPTYVLPQHYKCFSREIAGPRTDYDKCSVAYTVMLADGGAEPHIHENSDHIYYVLKGGFVYRNFKDPDVYVNAGEAILAPAGITHQVAGNGKEDCEYIVCTTPPAWAKPAE